MFDLLTSSNVRSIVALEEKEKGRKRKNRKETNNHEVRDRHLRI